MSKPNFAVFLPIRKGPDKRAPLFAGTQATLKPERVDCQDLVLRPTRKALMETVNISNRMARLDDPPDPFHMDVPLILPNCLTGAFMVNRFLAIATIFA